MSIFNKTDAYNATCLKIENEFETKIKKQISDEIRQTVNNGNFSISLGTDYNKYYWYIKQYFKKEKHYHVYRFFGDYAVGEFIEISWD